MVTLNLIHPKGRLETNDYNWHGLKSFWTNIEKNLDNIRHVYMAGGEPMMIERHYEFLEKCIKKDVAQNILLEYNTNMTTLPIELWKCGSHLKKLELVQV